jgi:hypothetical protein
VSTRRFFFLTPVVVELLTAASCGADFVPIVEGDTGDLIGARPGGK